MKKNLLFVFVTAASLPGHAQFWDKVGTLVPNLTVEVVYNDTATNSLYVGGNFNVSGYTRIAKWDGAAYSTLGSGMDGTVKSILRYNGNLYAGGNFTVAGGVITNRIAKWNGSAWSMVGTGITSSVVNCMCIYNGELIVGGYFTTAGGVPANYIAKWNGTAWSALGTGMDNEVQALCVYNGELYAAGEFLNAGGVSANYIAKWNGSTWSALGSGTNLFVDDLYVWNSVLYVGGRFTSAGGSTAYYLAKWNGGTWSAAGLGVNDSFVFTLASYNGELYAGGQTFATSSPIFGDHIVKWNGSSWGNVGTGLTGSSVYSLTAYKGQLYAGGDFTIASASRLARWDNIAPATTRFQKVYQGANASPNNESPFAVEQTIDWGYVVAGYTTSYGAGNGDAFIIKTDTAGVIGWAKVYGTGGGAGESAKAVVTTSDGSMVVTGLRQTGSNNDVMAMGLDKDGVIGWVKTYGSTASNEQGFGVKQTSAISNIICGTVGTSAAVIDPLMIKVNGAGNIVWQKRYTTAAPEAVSALELTSSGGFLLSGTTALGSANEDAYLLNMDPNGNVLWDRSFGGTGEEKGYVARQTKDGGFIVAGRTLSFGLTTYDGYLVKLTSAGAISWSKIYGTTTDHEEIHGVEQKADGSYLLTGFYFYAATGKMDLLAVKVASDGSFINAKIYGGPEWESAVSMDKTSDGGLVALCQTNSFPYSNGADYNVYLVKTDSVLSSGSCHENNVVLQAAPVTSASSTPGAVVSAPGLIETIQIFTEAAAPFKAYELNPTLTTSNTNVNCNGGNNGQASVSVQGGFSPYTFQWSNGSSTTTSSNLAAGIYTITVTDSTLCVVSATVSITQPTALGFSTTVSNVACFSSSTGAIDLSVTGGVTPYAYLWSPGNKTTQDITGLAVGNYSCVVADANGCTGTTNASVTNSIPPVPICMVTVDTVASLYNTLIWEKPVIGGIDSFFIYRNVSTLMTKIGGVKYSAVSMFKDTTPGVLPKNQAHEYALSMRDTCGNESALSPTHITIHQLAPNYTFPPIRFDLSWSPYQGFSFTDYEIWRDTIGNDSWHQIGLVPFALPTTYSDFTSPHDSSRYRIQVTPAQPCVATIKNPVEPLATTVKSGKSNSSDKLVNPTGIGENNSDVAATISPNPSNGTFNVSVVNGTICYVRIYDALGQNIYSENPNARTFRVIIPNIAKGVYHLQVVSTAGTIDRRIVISR